MQATSNYVAPTGPIGTLIKDLEWEWQGHAKPADHNDWDWWRVQEYQPRCAKCDSNNNYPQVWCVGGTDVLFAVCEQCGHAYQFEYR